MLLAFHKPYGVLSQFTPDHPGQRVLTDFRFPPAVYPIGRLDADSEGLLLLSDEKNLVDRLLNPKHGHPRTYHTQVEGIPSEEMLIRLRSGGLDLRGHRTAPCQVRLLGNDPGHPPRDPPIRVRLSIPDTWIELTLTEGKNRQVRRMTAAIGHPTLRLIRVAIGDFPLGGLLPGQWRELDEAERRRVFEGGGDPARRRGSNRNR